MCNNGPKWQLECQVMGFLYWFTICAIFLTCPFMLGQSIIFLRRGVYT